jgi:hypothetical protein
MNNVVTHERFNRSPVVQANKRLRRGTISFERFRVAVMTHPDFAREYAPRWYRRVNSGGQ